MFKNPCQKSTRRNYDCDSFHAKTHSLLNQSINVPETGDGVQNFVSTWPMRVVFSLRDISQLLTILLKYPITYSFLEKSHCTRLVKTYLFH